MADVRKVAIPEGSACSFGLRDCVFAVYSKHRCAYNCRLYHKLLRGKKHPEKCPECIDESADTACDKIHLSDA